MPIKKISDKDVERPCLHPTHNPPMHIVLEPGLYEHTCPACGKSQRFSVVRPVW